MNALFRFFLVIGAIPVVLTLIQRGVLSVEQGGLVLVGIVVAVSVISSLMRVLLPLFAVLLFITYNATTTNEIKQLSASLLGLVIVLFGFFIILRGAVGRRGHD